MLIFYLPVLEKYSVNFWLCDIYFIWFYLQVQNDKNKQKKNLPYFLILVSFELISIIEWIVVEGVSVELSCPKQCLHSFLYLQESVG